MLKLRKFSIYYPFKNTKSTKGILFNSFNGKVIVIDKELYTDLKRGIEEEEGEKNYAENWSFIKEFYLEEENGRSRDILKEKLIDNKYNSKKLVVTILSTLNCNLSCVYCYQQGIVDRELDLKESTGDNIKRWFLGKIEELNPEEVIVHFYGGEPLLNLGSLEKIISPVMSKCREKEINFSSYMTTNGTLLNMEKIEKLKKWNMDNVQISLDGTKEIHDERRPFNGDSGSYDIIVKNIELALKNSIKVVVRLNIDKHNEGNVEEFFKDFRGKGFHKYNLLQMNIEIVSPIMNPSSHCMKYTHMNEEEMKTLVGLWEKQVKYGFPIKSAMPIDSACENSLVNSYTISSNGDLYTCPGFIGIDEMIIGNINTELDTKKYKELIEVNHWDNIECLECEYLPVCQGGCKMCAYVTNKEYNTTYCRKKFIEQIYPEFLINKYRIEGE